MESLFNVNEVLVIIKLGLNVCVNFGRMEKIAYFCAKFNL